jgi:hypothetical protein
MSRNSFLSKLSPNILLLFVIFTVLFFAGCAVEAAKTGEKSSGKTDGKQTQILRSTVSIHTQSIK